MVTEKYELNKRIIILKEEFTMRVNAHFEKVSEEQYINDRFKTIVYQSSRDYLVQNGIYIDDLVPGYASLQEREEKLRKIAEQPYSNLRSQLVGLFIREYNNIKLPTRSNMFCLGYDFMIPFDLECIIQPLTPVNIPTGIRCVYDLNMLNSENFSGLFIFDRSSTGIKKNLVLSNGTGVIEPDYFAGDNQGEIFVSLTPNNNKNGEALKVSYTAGDRFAQGVFLPVGMLDNEAAEFDNRPSEYNDGLRTGGVGSTGR